MNTGEALNVILAELETAVKRFGPMASMHEGYAVILEEVDELWVEVKAQHADHATREAVQVAAMAIRFLIDQGSGDGRTRSKP
jgi:hypothetical protein